MRKNPAAPLRSAAAQRSGAAGFFQSHA